MSPEMEDRCVAVLLRLSAAVGEERCAPYPNAEERAAMNAESDQLALKLAHDHGIDSSRLRALVGLARQRAVGLDVVLRAALRGDLREIVTMPAVKAEQPPAA